jgi:hypothetical protein
MGQKRRTSKPNGDSVSGQTSGNYLLAFVLRKKGIPQPAVISPGTTPTRCKLATLCTWWNGSARGRFTKNLDFIKMPGTGILSVLAGLQQLSFGLPIILQNSALEEAVQSILTVCL